MEKCALKSVQQTDIAPCWPSYVLQYLPKLGCHCHQSEAVITSGGQTAFNGSFDKFAWLKDHDQNKTFMGTHLPGNACLNSAHLDDAITILGT